MQFFFSEKTKGGGGQLGVTYRQMNDTQRNNNNKKKLEVSHPILQFLRETVNNSYIISQEKCKRHIFYSLHRQTLLTDTLVSFQ